MEEEVCRNCTYSRGADWNECVNVDNLLEAKPEDTWRGLYILKSPDDTCDRYEEEPEEDA